MDPPQTTPNMTSYNTSTRVGIAFESPEANRFRYAGPVATIAYFWIAKLYSVLRLEQPLLSGQDRRRRHFCVTLLVFLGLMHCFELATYLHNHWNGTEGWPQEKKVIRHCAYILIHASLTLSILGTPRPIWHHYEGAMVVAMVEQIQALQRLLSKQQATDQHQTSNTQQIRVYLLAPLATASIVFRYASWHDQKSFPSAKDNVVPVEEATSSADEEDDDRQKEIKLLKARQTKRLLDAGDWWSFIKQYKFIVPLFWPSGDRKTQYFMAVLLLQLLFARVLSVMVPRQLGIVTDGVAGALETNEVPWSAMVTWALLAFVGSSGCLGAIRQASHVRVDQFSFRKISSTSFSHIMGLSMDFHNDKSSAELFQAMYQGHRLQEMFNTICFRLWPRVADLAIGMIVVAHTYDDYITFLMLSSATAYLWLGMMMAPQSVKYRRQYSRLYGEFNKTQCDGLVEWQTVTQFNQQRYECERFEQKLAELQQAQLQYYDSDAFKRIAQGMVMTTSCAIATLLVMYRIAQGTMPIGSIVSFVAYWSKIMDPLDFFGSISDEFGTILVDSERMLELLQTKATVADAPDAVDIDIASGRVEFEHVDFSYDPRKATIKDLSFTTTAGTTTALVGETGSGKTTVLTLLYRYFDVASGSIEIDGQDIRGVTLDSLRNLFGVVSQDAALFNVTLMENIRYARLDATDDEVMEVCRAAAIHDKIMQFPDQYKTKVGERGIKLSGGELQRVAIARALLRDPKIVVLDEATSQIDVETEAIIQQALRKLTAGRTTFVIAHRLSTIQHADQILVIGDGKILERGTHYELLKKSGKYASLWQTQLKMEEGNTHEEDQAESGA